MIAFYGRRARRILPPLYLYLLLLAPFAFLTQRELLNGWLAAVTFTYNFYNLTSSFVNTRFLSHLWSLAVEEQFYLTFPLLMVLLRRRATTVLLLLCLGMPVVRLGFTALASQGDTFVRADFLGDASQMVRGSYATYIAGFTQFDVFAIGALLQLHSRRLPSFNTGAAILALLLVMMLVGLLTTGSAKGAFYGAFLVTPGAYQYVWGYTLIALLGALLVIHFSAWPVTSPLLRAFASPGAHSYEFYILHYPVLGIFALFVPIGAPATRLAAALVCLPVTACLAVLLHRASALLVTAPRRQSPRPA